MIVTDSAESSTKQNRPSSNAGWDIEQTVEQTLAQQIHIHVIILIAALAFLLAAYVLHIHDGNRVSLTAGGQLLPEICMFKIMTGLPCMGCGLTRSVISSARGDFVAAANYNSIGIAVFLLVLVQVPIRISQITRLRSGKQAWRLPSLIWILVPMLVWLLIRWLFVIF